MNIALLVIPAVLAFMARRKEQATLALPSSTQQAGTKPQAGKPQAGKPAAPHKPKRPGKAHGVNPDGTLKWDPKEHPAITLDTPAGPAEVLKPQKRKPRAPAKRAEGRGFKSLDFSNAPASAPPAPARSTTAPSAPNINLGGGLARRPPPRKPARARPRPVRQAPDVVADASNIAPSKRSPAQAAADLYAYVTGPHPKWGVKNDPSTFIADCERDMGNVPVQGIYGPLDRARGKQLIGKNFPPRH
jgi:hypothetical protein